MKITWWIFSLSALWIYKQRTNFCEGCSYSQVLSLLSTRPFCKDQGSSRNISGITCDTSEWPAPNNGQTSCAGQPQVDPGTLCEITCDEGYEVIGKSSSTCGSEGEWDPRTTASCKVRECQPLTEPDHGQITPYMCKIKPLHGLTCLYECRPGFRVIGPNSSKCDNGNWTHGGFFCQDLEAPSFGKTCPLARSVLADEGKTSATISWEPVIASDNDQAIVTVTPHVTSPHIFSEGSHSVTYTATDPSGNVKFCYFQVTVQVLRCPVLSAPVNGVLENAACGNVYGRTCRLTCNKGYEIKGSKERKCDKKSRTNVVGWTGNDTHCEAIHCPALADPVNSVKSGYGCAGASTTYGTSCFFTCMTGYYMVSGSQKRTCLHTGTWSGTQLRCKGVLNHSPHTVLVSNLALLAVPFLWAILIFMYFRKRRALKSPNRPDTLLQSISLNTIEVNQSGTVRGNPSRNPVEVTNVTNLWDYQVGLNDRKEGYCLPKSFPTVPVSKYITQVERCFSSSGGELSAASDSDVKINIGNGVIGDSQSVFYRVIDDETELLRDIPVGPKETLISPVIETGPHDIKISKPLEIIIPHCLYMDKEVEKNKEKWISVYRTDPGPVKWEKIPPESKKNDSSKAWFTATHDSIHIKTKTFSFWSIFSRRRTRRKRARVFASKPNPRSVYLRFYIYDDNEYSRRWVENQEKRLTKWSTPTIEIPFLMCDNGSETINVRLTDLNGGWKLRTEADGRKEFVCLNAHGRRFQCEGACEFVLKQIEGRVGTDRDFDCTVTFQQEGRDVHTMKGIPEFQCEERPEPVNDPHQTPQRLVIRR